MKTKFERVSLLPPYVFAEINELKAKERLKVLCGKKVLIEVVDKGKYGRPLINIFTGETERDICKILIEEKLAIKYQGEKKTFVW